nr:MULTISPECIES: sensor histidine kinase N-terminal domain-containing protein [Paracoccus]
MTPRVWRRWLEPARLRSLRHRLVWQFLVLSALLVAGLFLTVGWVAERASRASQDAVLGAAVTAIAEGIRSVDEGLEMDLPYATFSMLGAMGDERIFYAVTVGGQVVTGYEGLPQPPVVPDGVAPVFWRADYQGAALRLASVARPMLIDQRLSQVTVSLGQTRQGQAAIARETALGATWVALAFLALALPVALLAAQAVLAPVQRLAEVVSARGPRDLSPVRHPAPRELAPLLRALNGLIARLRAALELAETFIFRAPHPHAPVAGPHRGRAGPVRDDRPRHPRPPAPHGPRHQRKQPLGQPDPGPCDGDVSQRPIRRGAGRSVGADRIRPARHPPPGRDARHHDRRAGAGQRLPGGRR